MFPFPESPQHVLGLPMGLPQLHLFHLLLADSKDLRGGGHIPQGADADEAERTNPLFANNQSQQTKLPTTAELSGTHDEPRPNRLLLQNNFNCVKD